MGTEGAKHTHIRFSLQVDMHCRCMGCVDKVDKAMVSIRTFSGVKTSAGDVGTGVVAVAGKVNPAELCQWLKRKTMKDVKIVRPRPPADDNRNKQKRTRDTTPSAPPLPQHLSRAQLSRTLATSRVQSDHKDLCRIEEKIRDLEKARDKLKIKNLKNELTAARRELKQSRKEISNGKKALLDGALNQLHAYKKLESLGQLSI